MTAFLDGLESVIAFINSNILWGIPMIIAILGTGIFLTVRSKGLQFRKFGTAMNSTIVPSVKTMLGKGEAMEGQSKKEKTISQFEAFSAALSGTVGTGNVVGVTGAIIAGGPGALFWMWVSALMGMMTNYAEIVLGMFYRKKDEDGNVAGGPMYYIQEGLKLKWLAVIFAVCCGLAAVGMGMVQTNSISGVLQGVIAGENQTGATVVAWVVGIVVAACTALIIIGGVKRLGKVASILAPFMSLFFILVAIVILLCNITALPKAVASIFVGAFSFRPVVTGFLGYTVMLAMRQGFARGIFSNEAGLGSGIIAQCVSDSREPVKQGMWGIFTIFLDTIVICTLTGLTLISAGINNGVDFSAIAVNKGMDKNVMASFAFSNTLGGFGTIAFSIVLPLFAFTTIIAWAFYGEKAVEYLFGKNAKVATTVFKVLFVVLLLVGALVKSSLVWELDDMFNAAMALPNLIALILMSGTVMKITKNYFDRKKGVAVEPLLSAYPERNAELAQREEE